MDYTIFLRSTDFIFFSKSSQNAKNLITKEIERAAITPIDNEVKV